MGGSDLAALRQGGECLSHRLTRNRVIQEYIFIFILSKSFCPRERGISVKHWSRVEPGGRGACSKRHTRRSLTGEAE